MISLDRLWELECNEHSIIIRTDNLTTDKQVYLPDIQNRIVSAREGKRGRRRSPI